MKRETLKKGSGVFFGQLGPHGKRLWPKKTPDPVHARRAGVVLIAVLVALLIVMLISATIVRGLVVQHRLASAEPIRAQAFWLAESALQRAQKQLESNVDYDGEMWQAELVSGGGEFGQVVIHVEPIENEPGKRTILVQARFPNDPINGVLEERSLVVATARPADES
ncbi:MAG TPA: hypothetical protein P5307_14375 [Pirellulaceae bacterium]|nr:hypothetical protein [Pirellulaceae bacterium]